MSLLAVAIQEQFNLTNPTQDDCMFVVRSLAYEQGRKSFGKAAALKKAEQAIKTTQPKSKEELIQEFLTKQKPVVITKLAVGQKKVRKCTGNYKKPSNITSKALAYSK